MEDAIVLVLDHLTAKAASRHLGITGGGLPQVIRCLAKSLADHSHDEEAAAARLNQRDRLGAELRATRQGRRNANDGLSFLRAAKNLLDESIRLLTRAAALAAEAKSNLPSPADRTQIHTEFQNILKAMDDIRQNTTFNGSRLSTTTTISISVGEGLPILFTVGPLGPGLLGLNAGDSLFVASGKAGSLLTNALQEASAQRSNLEASLGQLASIANRLGIRLENVAAAQGQLRDTNLTEEVANLTRFQILQQSTLSVHGQNSPASREILALLRCFQHPQPETPGGAGEVPSLETE